MNDNRRQILDMLAENKITAAEAERLLSAVENDLAALRRQQISACAGRHQ